MNLLTVDDVLSAPAEYDHSTEIRSVGPAVLLVLEREAPLRLETLASTEAEFAALREWISSNDRARLILGAFFEAKDDETGGSLAPRRDDEHAARLRRARRIGSARVGGSDA